ncbi:MAG: flagellar protein [Rhodobacter sp.]|nr:flagellar protein [Rhodobacter sp.]
MSFQPVLPLTGYAGWGFLKRTMARQQAVQLAAPVQRRDEAYFRDRIGKIATAEQLVSDKRLLRITLTAFGLEGDINSKAFIQKVLEGGTLKEGSLANRLADKQYQKLSSAFGFGDYSVPRTKISTFPDEILSQFRARSFEAEVGAQNNTYRLALNAERGISELAAKSTSETAKWYSILGNAPLREVLQTALGLPKSFASIDLDQQVSVLKAKAEAAFGSASISQFADPAKLEGLVRRFMLRAEMQEQGTGSSPAAIALALLRS